jgi:hypothetical protein
MLGPSALKRADSGWQAESMDGSHPVGPDPGPPAQDSGNPGVIPGGEKDLTVAVTGPTGTFGFGVIPQLQADDRVARIVGIARRPFDPAVYGWTKMEYRRGDVRDMKALHDTFGDSDVVVHLAFMVTGAASAEAIRSINIERFPGCGHRRRPPLCLFLLGGGLRIPPRQPDRHDRGLARATCRPAVLCPGEGRP